MVILWLVVGKGKSLLGKSQREVSLEICLTAIGRYQSHSAPPPPVSLECVEQRGPEEARGVKGFGSISMAVTTAAAVMGEST